MSETPPELYLVRHAEDEGAATGRFVDGGLSDRGRAQALRLGGVLNDIPFSCAWISPLARARETADLVLGDRSIPREVEPALAEGALGQLAGLAWEAAREEFPQYFRAGGSVIARIAAAGATAPGGESRRAFLDRAGIAAERMSRHLRCGVGRTLVISHGGLLNYALQILTGLTPKDEVPFGFDHCGVVRVIGYDERPGFGPFPMLRFGEPSPR